MSAPAPAGILAGLSHDLASTVELVGRSVVAIHARRRIPSSGIVWRPGIVATAAHTLTRDEDITVTLASGRTAAATLAGRDPATDLAVLRLEDAAVPPVERGDTAALQVGRLVLALGRPGPQITASLGIISAVGGEWRTWQGGRIEHFLRLDLAIYDGFSGGPLVEAGGRVLGLNTSGLSRAMALAIPAATVDRVADQLLASGRVGRGYLGLAVQPVQLPARLREARLVGPSRPRHREPPRPAGPAETAGCSWATCSWPSTASRRRSIRSARRAPAPTRSAGRWSCGWCAVAGTRQGR
jgi:S1-C subfamily serine protease